MPKPVDAFRGGLPLALLLGALLCLFPISTTEAQMKSCPLNKSQMDSGIRCPEAGGDLVAPTAEAPQTFDFCNICPKCWTGIAVEAGSDYRLRVLGEPEDWKDKGWEAATVEKALKGWSKLSEIPDTGLLERFFKSPFVWLAKGSRPVPEADWFQVFFAVRDAAGKDSDPVRLTAREQSFTAPTSGELYFFVNDHPDYYDNNTGRMMLEISLTGP